MNVLNKSLLGLSSLFCLATSYAETVCVPRQTSVEIPAEYDPVTGAQTRPPRSEILVYDDCTYNKPSGGSTYSPGDGIGSNIRTRGGIQKCRLPAIKPFRASALGSVMSPTLFNIGVSGSTPILMRSTSVDRSGTQVAVYLEMPPGISIEGKDQLRTTLDTTMGLVNGVLGDVYAPVRFINANNPKYTGDFGKNTVQLSFRFAKTRQEHAALAQQGGMIIKATPSKSGAPGSITILVDPEISYCTNGECSIVPNADVSDIARLSGVDINAVAQAFLLPKFANGFLQALGLQPLRSNQGDGSIPSVLDQEGFSKFVMQNYSQSSPAGANALKNDPCLGSAVSAAARIMYIRALN